MLHQPLNVDWFPGEHMVDQTLVALLLTAVGANALECDWSFDSISGSRGHHLDMQHELQRHTDIRSLHSFFLSKLGAPFQRQN
jgi:hypothetical protein